MKFLFISAAFFWAMIALASASGYDGNSAHLVAASPSEAMIDTIRNKHEPHDPTALAVNPDDPIETPAIPETSPNPQDASVLFGIDCRGNGRCSLCDTNIDKLLEVLDYIADNTYYGQGRRVVCSACHSNPSCKNGQCPSLCVVAQNLTRGQRISAKLIKEKVRMIKEHGCKKCGNCPIYGNDAKDGVVTIYFDMNGCPQSICP